MNENVEDRVKNIMLLLETARQFCKDETDHKFECPICGGIASGSKNRCEGIRTWCLECGVVVIGCRDSF